MKVRDIMRRKAETVSPDEDARVAFRKFESRHVDHLTVVEKGKPVGILSPSDYNGVVHHAEKGHKITAEMIFGGLSVRSLMTPDPVTTSPDAPLESVASLMLRHRVQAVPVVEDGALTGIVSTQEILASVAGGKLGG